MSRPWASRRSSSRFYPILFSGERHPAHGTAEQREKSAVGPVFALDSAYVLSVVIDVLNVRNEIDFVTLQEFRALDQLPSDKAGDDDKHHAICGCNQQAVWLYLSVAYIGR